MTATRFLQTVCVSNWNELNQAAQRFARQAGLENHAYYGTRDFMGVSWLLATLDHRIGGAGLGLRAPGPDLRSGYAHLSADARSHARRLAQSWFTTALTVIDHADFAHVADPMKAYYRIQAEAAKVLYQACLTDVSQLAPGARGPYLSQLLADPSDIWTAYKVGLFPSQQQMASRLSMCILAGHNPYAGEPPPTSAAESILGYLWE